MAANMNKDLTKAKELLKDDLTLVLARGEEIIYSKARGVKPLVDLLCRDLDGFSAADRVVGKGAAFCYIALSVKAVWTRVISAPAKQLLEQSGVAVYYDTLVSRIENRAGTDYCPIESAVLEIDDTDTAIIKIKETLNKLR